MRSIAWSPKLPIKNNKSLVASNITPNLTKIYLLYFKRYPYAC